MSSASPRPLREAWKRWGHYLYMPLLTVLGSSNVARTGDLPPPIPTTSGVATGAAGKGNGSPDIEARFRRLEAIVDQQAGQIRRLSEENRRLAGQVRNRSRSASDSWVTPAQAPETAMPPLPGPELP